MAETIFESSLVATVCFVKDDKHAINLPRILVGASVMLRVEPLAKEKVVLWSILLPSNITYPVCWVELCGNIMVIYKSEYA